MMRICLLTSSYPRFEGDVAGNFIRELCVELTRRGFLFDIVAPDAHTPPGELADRGITVTRFRYFPIRRFQRFAYGDGIEENVKRNPARALLLPLFLFSFLARAWKTARRCDMVWSHWLIPSGVAGEVVARLQRKAHCITVHSTPSETMTGLLRPILGRRTRLVTVSRTLQRRLAVALGKNPQSIHRIPMGVRTGIRASARDREALREKYGFGKEFIVLFMGRLIKIKGVHLLVRATRNLPHTLLLIAGEGPCRQDLETLARRLGAPVRFEPFLRGTKKFEWLSLCDIFASPSLRLRSGRSEGLPVSILEALASGTPVVACDSGGIGEAVIDNCNGFLVTHCDEAALQEALTRLRMDDLLREKMGARALESACAYRLDAVADRYARLLRDCSLPGEPHPPRTPEGNNRQLARHEEKKRDTYDFKTAGSPVERQR
jgi:phosphatidylinositol alpha-1,6-mannosyltransferase